MAAVRGAPIATLGTADLALRDARGQRRRIMQADQMTARIAREDPAALAAEALVCRDEADLLARLDARRRRGDS